MCMKPTPVALAQDTVLQSERNGDARIYWSPSSTYKSFRYGTSLDFEWMIHSRLNGSYVEVFAQVSADGRSWEDVTTASGTSLLGQTTLSGLAGDQGIRTIWLGGVIAKANFVRLGIQVTSADSSQAEVGLTLTVTPRDAGGDVFITDDYDIDAVVSDTAIGEAIDVTDAETVTLVAAASGMDTGKVCVVALYTATDPQASEWLPTGIEITLTEGATEAAIDGGPNQGFLSYIKAFQVYDVNSSTAGTLYATATIRPIR